MRASPTESNNSEDSSITASLCGSNATNLQAKTKFCASISPLIRFHQAPDWPNQLNETQILELNTEPKTKTRDKSKPESA